MKPHHRRLAAFLGLCLGWMTLSAASAQTPATPNPPDAPAAPQNPIDPKSSVRALPSPPDAPAPASASDSAPSSAATQTPVSAAQGPAIQLAPEDDDVPMQSPILLGDSPKSAARKGGAVSLPRQSQIDVALDARTKKLRGAAVGGYGEAILTAPIGGNNPAVIDLRRTVLFFGYNFTDHIRFFSEVEYEHALTSGDAGGEVAIEQAMLDFMFRRYFNIRVGMGVLPVSLINIYHEPSTFNGAERPDVDLRIVPSTWQQMLAGFYGAVGPVRYQIFVTPGLSASGFSADTGIRGGRQENMVKTRDVGIVGRLDYSPFLGGNIGVSGYWARAGQGDVSLGDVAVTMAALDTKLSRFGLTLRGQFSYVYVSEVEGLNRALALSTPSAGPISRHLLGGYVELSYDLLRLVPHNLGFQLLAFGRYERTDTQLSVPDSGVGFVRKPGNDRTVYTAGLTFRPILEVAVKLDYQRRHTEVADSATDQLNAAIAYQF